MRPLGQSDWGNRVQPVRSRSMVIPDGDAGVAVTIRLMRGAVMWGSVDPGIRELALWITRDVANRDSEGEIAAIYDWVKRNIKFRGEYDEVVQRPDVTLRFQAGDCDDHSVLIAALLGSIGYPSRFSTVAIRGEKDLTHVYAEIQDPKTGQWKAMDSTVDQASPGWEPPDITRKFEWKALGDMRTAFQPRYVTRYPGRSQRRLGDDAIAQAAQDINAAMPLFNAVADVQTVDYNRSLYPGPRSAVGLNYAPGNLTLTGVSSIPTVLWVGGAGLLAAIYFMSRNRNGRR